MHRTREMTHSYVKASNVISRDTDKVKIIDMLVDNVHISDDNISVIPVVGIGGLGNTTLAQSVYNDENVVGKFDLKMWVCVSLDFDVTKLIREILLAATNTERDLNKLSKDQLQTSLRDTLKDKKFLLVLDDVWSDDRSKWNELRGFLTAGAEGSKIIVTTRNTYVALIMSKTPAHLLKGLSEDDSLSLFFKCAFGDEQLAEQNPQLKAVGKEIVNKCGGVPLALKTLGCLLYSKTEVEWKFVSDNEIWELERAQGGILPALQLSYDTMSASLKQCFAYCSTFPDDSTMFSIDLIYIWMALGLLYLSNKKMELEDIGELHFKELCARSFFEYDDNDDDYNYGLSHDRRMHDLIHNLACSITQDNCSIVNSNSGRISECTRNLRIFLNENNLRFLQNLRKLRSIYVDWNMDNENRDAVQSFLSIYISRFKHLRVFDLRELPLESLPSSIGILKHLRYLNLRDTRIKKLPDSICKLQSLETLYLNQCRKLEELPRYIKNMVNLRTLLATTKQTCLPENGIGRLESLRHLGLVQCRNLRSLRHDLRCCTTLRTLVIVKCKQIDLASKSINDEVVQLSLQRVVINDLPETTTFPSWLQGAAKTLQHLWIEKCPKLTVLPECLPNLTSLHKLVIKKCPELLSLPEGMQHLTSLTHFEIKKCHALEERCKCGVSQDWPKISHVPNIIFGGERLV